MIFLLKFVFILVQQSVQKIISADCFYSGFTASQSPLFCEAKYSGLHFAHKLYVLLRFFLKVFSRLWRAIPIIIFHNNLSPHEFQSLTIIGKLQAVCRGVSQKFYKKIAEKFSRQPHIKRKSDITQTSFLLIIYSSLITEM